MEKIRLKPGEYFDKALGYVMVYDPTRRICIPKHRIIAEQRLGRKLSFNEIVHHIDQNKKNNAPSNLRIETRLEHNMKRHKKESNFYGDRNPAKHMTAQHRANIKAAWIKRKRMYGATGAKYPENLRRKGYEARIKRKD